MGGGGPVRGGFQTSRDWPLASMASTDVGSQRVGAALPSFAPRGIAHAQAPELPREINPPLSTHDLAPPRGGSEHAPLRRQDTRAARSPSRRVIRELTPIASVLKPTQSRIAGALEPNAPTENTRSHLVSFLVTNLNRQDNAHRTELLNSMEIAGAIGPADVLITRLTTAVSRPGALKRGLILRNRIIRRAITDATERSAPKVMRNRLA